MGYGIDNPCNCSKLGTVDHSTCDPITGQCPCRNKLTIGRDCRECTKLSFLHPVTGCHPCPPCPKPRSLGSCHTNQRGVVVCDCLGNYSGSECKYCAPNFYVSGDSCEPCKCGNNTHPEQSRECDLHTGVCINCLHNTTGKYCHKCLRNYVGDPLVAKNCTHIDDVPRPMRSSHYSPVYQFFHDHLGVIVGILVSILTLLTLIVALTIYKRWRRWKRRPLQFWTVQLKEDHERVSFSSDHPYQHVDASLLSDDVQFRIPTDTSYENDEPNHRLKTRTRAGDSANPYQSLN